MKRKLSKSDISDLIVKIITNINEFGIFEADDSEEWIETLPDSGEVTIQATFFCGTLQFLIFRHADQTEHMFRPVFHLSLYPV